MSRFSMITGMFSGGETGRTCPMCAGPIPIGSDRLTCSSRCRSRKGRLNRRLALIEAAVREGRLDYHEALQMVKRGQTWAPKRGA